VKKWELTIETTAHGLGHFENFLGFSVVTAIEFVAFLSRFAVICAVIGFGYCSVSTKGSLFLGFSLTEMAEKNYFEL
jgi:hypothetical protein